MLKGILAGLVAGALATACVLKAMAMHQGERAGGKTEAPAAGAPDPAELRTTVDGLKAGNEALRKSLEARKTELASIEKKEEGGGKKKRKKAGEKTWKELAPLLAKAFGMNGEGDRDNKELQAAQIDFMALIARIAKQRGVALDEAMTVPEGLPALLRAMLESGDPPATPEQLAEIDALIAKYGKDWEGIRGDQSLTSKLEKKVAISELADGYMQSVLDTMSDAQKAGSKSFEMFGMMSEGMGGNSHYTNGTRESVTSNLTDAWAKALKFDESQKAQLAPYLDAYMKDYQAAQERIQSESQPDDRSVWKKIQREQVKAQIRAQQAMAAGLSLSPAQQKALRDWGTTYQFWIDASPQPADPDEPPPPMEK
ncbi:MAG: hypothetical protein FD180_1538 [Planctomycetota bacterium]|nr:MAG: hypothetical protein FD180_1538 [Planctomycetota bacterium]